MKFNLKEDNLPKQETSPELDQIKEQQDFAYKRTKSRNPYSNVDAQTIQFSRSNFPVDMQKTCKSLFYYKLLQFTKNRKQ